MNKKAQGLNITTIIIVILAILVLVIVAVSFTVGMKEMVDKIKEFFGMSTATSAEEAKNFCDVWCSQEQYKTWCTYQFKKIEEGKTFKCSDSKIGSVCPGATEAKVC